MATSEVSLVSFESAITLFTLFTFHGSEHLVEGEFSKNTWSFLFFANSPWTKCSDPQKVKNVSSYTLQPNEKILLGLGLNFALPPSRKDNLLYLSKVSRRPELLSLLGKDSLLKSSFKLPLSQFTALKNLRRNKLITIKRADKGGSVVIMNRHDYQNKCLDLLSDSETYQNLNKFHFG